MRFDLERNRKPIADIDNSGILTWTLQHSRTLGGQAPQVHTRAFVAAVLAPHHAEDAEFGNRRLASAEQFLDLFIFFGRKAVLADEISCDGRSG